ncbi:MAG: hypothetical protein DRG33_05135 [Deltaproteobacteria bacterium]|uniref:Uncharacterized protein n=1 Tax=candidate division WOR-3 bacterium TaxID=2052148 RepID=A0A7C0X8C1_UNCW3|nr:MAG: hypothetical protein DRG33_05135 [Deltaproteobacteria bacterium]HDM89581.1 hypothetical protein [candidate division WOR-3 bacterium]
MGRGKEVLIAVLSLFALWQGICRAAELKVSSGVRIEWWEEEDVDAKGAQISHPIEITLKAGDFTFKGFTAYVSTYYDAPHGGVTYREGLIDTKFNFSYEIIGKLPVDVLLGLDLNLPTGTTPLRFEDSIMLSDPELFTITTIGEGLNVNPTVALAKQWGKWIIGIGIGYTWRGEYDFIRYRVENYDPGDVFTFTAKVGYEVFPGWLFALFGRYFHFGKDEINGVEEYQEGDLYSVGLSLNRRGEKWQGRFRAEYSWREKGKERRWDSVSHKYVFDDEEHNFYDDEFTASLSVRYLVDEKTVLRGKLSYLRLDENRYPEENFYPYLYRGGKEKLSLSLGVEKAIFDHVNLEFDVSGFVLWEGKGWTIHWELSDWPWYTQYRDDSWTCYGGTVTLLLSCFF